MKEARDYNVEGNLMVPNRHQTNVRPLQNARTWRVLFPGAFLSDWNNRHRSHHVTTSPLKYGKLRDEKIGNRVETQGVLRRSEFKEIQAWTFCRDMSNKVNSRDGTQLLSQTKRTNFEIVDLKLPCVIPLTNPKQICSTLSPHFHT